MQKDFSEYAAVLEEQLDQVTQELSDIGIQDPTTHDWVAVPESSGVNEPDPNINADTTEEWNERRAVLSQLETRYQNVVRALQKIADGSFGVCEICQRPIEEDRLSVQPAARTCKVHLEEEASLPY